MAEKVLQLNDADEYEIKIKKDVSDKLIFIKFSADWCTPCKAVSSTYEQLAKENSDHIFYELNIDAFEDITEEEGVSTIPYFLVYQNGIKIDKFNTGSNDLLIELINKSIQKTILNDDW